jgi:hypothetical protein
VIKFVIDVGKVRLHQILILLLNESFSPVKGVVLEYVVDHLALDEEFEVESGDEFIAYFLAGLCVGVEVVVGGEVGPLERVGVDPVFQGQFAGFVLKSEELAEGGRSYVVCVAISSSYAEVCINSLSLGVSEVCEVVVWFGDHQRREKCH